ncbi:MAG: CvpA family protein [Ruminococcaceae bacterium]|nr:CvpA family protein [Oscillospiraceae bacterium]
MGTEFFWFYDVILIAVVIGMIFLGVKRGFVRMLLSLVSVAVAFVAALIISDSVSSWIYESFVEQNLKTSITDTVNDAIGENVVTQLTKVDMDKAIIGGKSVSSMDNTLKVDDAGKITIDLSSVDLSKTGIEKIDLTSLGFDKNTDYSSIKIGKVQIYEAAVKEHGLGNIILAQVISDRIMNTSFGNALKDIVKTIDNALPFIGLDENMLSQVDNTLLSDLVISLLRSGGNPGQSVLDNIVKPVVLIPMRTLIFIILFVIISILLSFVIKATSLINKIPLIGTLNEFLGAIMGLVHGVIVIFVIVIVLNMIITLTENSLIFLNESTIDKSFVFSWIYNFKFLDFLK